MAEFRKATHTQESNVLNLKLLISRCEIVDPLVTLLYAKQRSMELLGLCSYAVGSILCRQGHGDTLRGTFRDGAAQYVARGAAQFLARNNLLFSNPSSALVSTNRCCARQRRRVREMKIIMKLDI